MNAPHHPESETGPERLDPTASEAWRASIPKGYQPKHLRKYEASNWGTIRRLMEAHEGTETADLIAWLVWHNCLAWQWGEAMRDMGQKDREQSKARAEEAEADLASLRQSLQIAQSAQREAERERDDLRDRLLAILDGDEGFVVAQAWKTSGRTKYDRCVHGWSRSDGCPVCLDEAIRAALSPREEPAAREQEAS